jgi:hypothetical protein
VRPAGQENPERLEDAGFHVCPFESRTQALAFFRARKLPERGPGRWGPETRMC